MIEALIALILIIVLAVYVSSNNKADARKERLTAYYKLEDKTLRVLDSHAPDSIAKAMKELSTAYHDAEPYLDDASKSLYKTDMEDLHDHLHDIEMEAWEKKALKHLVTFADSYYLITCEDLHNFNDVELLFKTKTKCINAWQNYFAVNLDQYRTTIYPKRYMREYLGEDYDPCMDSHDTLEKKLSECIQTMRPEYRRKMRLYELLIKSVHEKSSVARSELLNTTFDGFTPQEVKSCYRELLRKNRLVEIKLGARWFVSLSDQELSKKKYNEEPPEPAEIKTSIQVQHGKETDATVYNAAMRLLQEQHLEYVDKTDKGGSLYFFQQSVADELERKGFIVNYAANGSKATAHRSAWYVK